MSNDNKIINEQVDRYYNLRPYKKNRSFSYTSGLNTKPRTIPTNLITYHEENENNNNDDDDEIIDDNLFYDYGLKKRNYTICNPKESLLYQKQLPKKVGDIDKINDSIEDLTKTEHDSIVNEMRHFYITFTSKIDLFNDVEDEKNIINNNSQEPNTRENKVINISLDNNNIDTNITTSLANNINEGITIKAVPITGTCEICTTGDIKNEKHDSSEDLLKLINQNDNNNNEKYNLEDNKGHDHTYSRNKNDYEQNLIHNHVSTEQVSAKLSNYNNDDNVNDVEIIKPNSVSSLSFNNGSNINIPRRRSSVFQLFFKNKSKNSVNAIPSQFSFNNSEYSSYSFNTINSCNVKSNKDSSVPQLFIPGKSNINSYTSSYNNDINDIINIGISSPILEEEPNIYDSTKKKKEKKRKNDRKRKSTLNDMNYDLNEVFKHPNIELVGRNSCNNNVISIFLAEKLRKLLPPYYRECQKWELVFSVIDHGSSITTLLNKCEETHLSGSFILAILDTNEYIYGAYLSEGIHVCKRFYGSGECFLWKLDNEKKELDYYRGSVENQYHIVTDKSFLAFGGGNGDFGLYISSDLLNGYTTHCPTYNNPPLTPKGNFECLNIEIWGFNFT